MSDKFHGVLQGRKDKVLTPATEVHALINKTACSGVTWAACEATIRIDRRLVPMRNTVLSILYDHAIGRFK